jgi:hypothetical protein
VNKLNKGQAVVYSSTFYSLNHLGSQNTSTANGRAPDVEGKQPTLAPAPLRKSPDPQSPQHAADRLLDTTTYTPVVGAAHGASIQKSVLPSTDTGFVKPEGNKTTASSLWNVSMGRSVI